MSEPIERLSQFTPNIGKLDRDTLLFEAGRASARPNRRWQALAAALSGVQVLTLAFLLPHAAAVRETNIVQTPSKALAVLNVPVPRPSRIWSIHQDLNELPLNEGLGDSLVLIDNEPALHAFGTPLPSAVN
jgi:hypothetical protein